MSGDLDLWVEQLEASLREVRAGGADPFEPAALAGLISRLAPEHPAVAEARAWALGDGREALGQALPLEEVEEEAERLARLDPEDEVEERASDVHGFDERCAGLHFAGRSERVRAAVGVVLPSIRAFPEAWRELIPGASRILAAVDPRADDPTLALWRAIEASGFVVLEDAPPVSIARAGDTLDALGLRPRASIRRRGEARLRAASDELRLPEEENLFTDGDVSVWLERAASERGALIVIASDRGTLPRLGLAGCEVPLRARGPGEWEAVAQPGDYDLSFGAESWPFLLTSD